MYLNKKNIDNIRNILIEKIKEVPEGKRLQIREDILEDLLFIKKSDKKNKIAKFLVWSGEFLSKIDLSKISFDDVVWNLTYCIENPNDFDKNYYGNTTSIDLSNTNVYIDFNKAYNNDNPITINNCNFKNVDLSNSNFSFVDKIYNSNLSNTNISIDLANTLIISNCDLSNNNFSDLSIDCDHLFSMSGHVRINQSNLKNTGINIIYDFERPEDYYKVLKQYNMLNQNNTSNLKIQQIKLYKILSDYVTLDNYGKKLGSLIKNGEFDGCFINGKLIKNEEQHKVDREDIIKNIEFIDNNYDNLISDLDFQIKILKKG